jgi:hypothetical protein
MKIPKKLVPREIEDIVNSYLDGKKRKRSSKKRSSKRRKSSKRR